MTDAPDNAARTARELARRTGVEHHDVLVILGTGLAPAAEQLGATGPSIPLATLPFFPRYTATGHHAQGWSVPIGDKMVLVFAGRCHAYEGIELSEVVHPLRTGIAAGCSTVILTAAVGGIRPDLGTGSVMVVSDHLNLTGRSPLSGPEFVDMVDAYAPELRALALATAAARPWPPAPTPRCSGPSSRRRPRSACCAPWARTWWACRWPSRRSRPATPEPPSSGWPSSPTRRREPPRATPASTASSPAGAAAVPTLAEIIRHVVVSLP
jgi:purine-nucleoside phosphorylase